MPKDRRGYPGWHEAVTDPGTYLDDNSLTPPKRRPVSEVLELERDPSSEPSDCAEPSPGAQALLAPVAIVGAGRLGTLLARELAAAGQPVEGPLSRSERPAGPGIVLLCVPDAEIESAAALIDSGTMVGHCSGASALELLAPHEAFSLHPLMTITRAGATLRGAGAAIAGSTLRALQTARQLALTLRLRPIEVDEEDRAAYHAAASVASNFLVTLESAAERIAGTAGLPRELLVPLVRATVENWAALGSEGALTGPLARGDEITVGLQRDAIAERAPDLLALFDVLGDATRGLAAGKLRERVQA